MTLTDHLSKTALAAVLATWLAWLPESGANAAEVKVAVAANFTEPFRQIATAFEAASGHKVVASFGATGQFYAQILQGAPFEVLIAADKATPAKAIAEGHAVQGSAFTYAVGKLVLFSKSSVLVQGEITLREGRFSKLAMANPATAPYGAAAVETMKALGVFDAVSPKLVQGNNIAQTFQFVETGNAELGFVALSQVAQVEGGSRWIVPANLHAPISQDAVLLKAGNGNDAARALLAFMKDAKARDVIDRFGYEPGR